MKQLNFQIMDLHKDLKQQFIDVETSGKYKRRDLPCEKLVASGHFTPVLVANDDNFLDCEYLFSLNEKIYSYEEASRILGAL